MMDEAALLLRREKGGRFAALRPACPFCCWVLLAGGSVAGQQVRGYRAGRASTTHTQVPSTPSPCQAGLGRLPLCHLPSPGKRPGYPMNSGNEHLSVPSMPASCRHRRLCRESFCCVEDMCTLCIVPRPRRDRPHTATPSPTPPSAPSPPPAAAAAAADEADTDAAPSPVSPRPTRL